MPRTFSANLPQATRLALAATIQTLSTSALVPPSKKEQALASRLIVRSYLDDSWRISALPRFKASKRRVLRMRLVTRGAEDQT